MEKYAPLNMSPEELVDYTPEWTGERFPDGRPRVSDAVLDRIVNVTITQAWAVLNDAGYKWQYEGGFKATHPGQVLVGRALTAVYMPRRPDMRRLMEEKGARLGCVGDQISWPIDQLVPRDVYVADVFGKIEQGAVIGDNLAAAICAKSGNGVVHDAAVRDVEGLREHPDFTSFVRGWHPTFASPTIMLLGVNAPIRIGAVTVMPGDVVLGKDEGVIFIPPHLAEKVVRTAEFLGLCDDFGKGRIAEGVYSSGRIDAAWGEDMESDFLEWASRRPEGRHIPTEELRQMLRERTW